MNKGEKRMRGWLVVNGFLDTEKYRELYSLLETAAKKRNNTEHAPTGKRSGRDIFEM